jgi:uncharacterized protein (TIGR03437 family)
MENNGGIHGRTEMMQMSLARDRTWIFLPIAVLLWSGLAWGQNPLVFFRTDYEVPAAQASFVVVADFNEDGKPDLVVANLQASAIMILLGNGDGSFQAPQYFSPSGPFGPQAMVAGDFNGDGHVDLAVLSGPQLLFIPGNGDGTFGEGQVVATGLGDDEYLGALAVGDFNKDGKLDLVTLVGGGLTGSTKSNATVLLGNGDGTFASSVAFEFPVPEHAVGLSVADFNGDGVLDLAVITQSWLFNPTSIYVGLGKGDGTFATPITTPAGVWQDSLVAADFNGDGKVDLAMESNSGTSVLLGNGDGTFRQFSEIPDAFGLGAQAAADFDGDGTIDLAFSYLSGVAISTGVGDGTFRAPASLDQVSPGGSAWGVVSADLHGGGKPDLIAGTNVSLQILINGTTAVTPPFAVASSATGVSSVAPASIASMYGSGLANGTASAATLPLPATLAGASIMVQDSAGISRPAALYYASPSQINFEVPEGSAPGFATVQLQNGGTTLSASALILRSAPTLFYNPSDGGAAAYTIAYGPNNQPGPPVLISACTTTGCALNPISRPAGSRVFLVLFGTGVRNAAMVTCSIGGANFPVSFAGAQGSFAGLDQINVEITAVPAGATELNIIGDGQVSNSAGLLLN